MAGDGPLVIKRIKKSAGGGHHGGAWKVAYADFVTAMMAFFLLMWLIGSTTKGDGLLRGTEHLQVVIRCRRRAGGNGVRSRGLAGRRRAHRHDGAAGAFPPGRSDAHHDRG